MKNKILFASVAFAAIFSLNGCKKEEKAIEPVSSIQQNENGSVELFPNAKVVSSEDSKKLVSITEDKLVFEGESEFLSSVKQGDILMAAVTDVAPDGYLRSVQQIEIIGSQYIFHTINSSLEKAIKNGKISIKYPVQFGPDDSELIAGKTNGFQYTYTKNIPLNYVLYDYDKNNATLIDQINTKGNLTLSAQMNVDMTFSWGSLTYFEANTTFGATHTQTLNLGGTFTLPEKTKNIYKITTIPSVSFFVGTVPVNIKPYVDVFLDYGGSITASAKFGYKGSASYTPGVKFVNNKWSTYGHKTLNFTANKPTGNLSASFGAHIRPRITFALYGCQKCASAYVEADVSAELQASLYPTVSKSMYAGIAFNAGATLFGYNKAYNGFGSYVFPIF